VIVGGSWSVCRVAEIIARRKISAEIICGSEERLGSIVSLGWIRRSRGQPGLRSVWLPGGQMARRTIWVALVSDREARGALVYPGLVEDEIFHCVNSSVALHPLAGVRLLG
jgi:hypothetical protein